MNNTLSLILIANDIRSAHNVGSLFRTASGAGVEKIFLTGYTMAPAPLGKLYKTRAEKEIHKTALGAELSVAYEKAENTIACITELRDKRYLIIGLEQGQESVDYRTPVTNKRVALLIGTEVEGTSDPLKALCDVLYEIPMHGSKNSLNVSVATGIALYQLRCHLDTR